MKHLHVMAALLILVACAPVPNTNSQTHSPKTPAQEPSHPQATSVPQAIVFPSPPPLLKPAEGNLIPNPGAEQAKSDASPSDWQSDHWGEQNPVFSWESKDPFSGQHYLAVTVKDYAEGDAKWFYSAQALAGDSWYEYSDVSRADGRNRLIVMCTRAGKRRFYSAGQSHASTVWTPNRMRFYIGTPCDAGSVMHTVDRNGYLHTDHHQLHKVAAQPLKRPLVSISFDDIYQSAAEQGAQALAQYQWRGTYYVTAKYARETQSKYAAPEQIKQLHASGHEIGSHAYTHPQLADLSNPEVISEVSGTHHYLKNMVGQDPEGIAYPFGDFDAEVEVEVKRYHRYARTSLAGLNDAETDPYRLKIMAVTRETTLAEMKQWVDDAVRSHTWLIFLFHDLRDGEGTFYTTSLSDYQALLTDLAQRKLTVLPVHEALAEVKNQ